MLKVTITDLDNGEVHLDEEMNSIVLMGERKDGKMAEVIMRTSIIEIAAMLSSGSKVKEAMMLATAMNKILHHHLGEEEDSLLNSILGGIGNEENLQ